MRTSKKQFSERGHYLKAETLEALDDPTTAAATLRAAHPEPSQNGRARLQIRISGPTLEALEAARALRDGAPGLPAPKSIGISKNEADKKNRAGNYTGETLRVYVNF